MLADDLHYRRVDVVVPAGGSLRHCTLATTLQAEAVTVAEDVFEDLVIAPEPAAFEPRLGARAVQLCAVEECRILRSPKQGRSIDTRAKRRSRPHLDHTRIDRIAAEISSDRYPMMPVDHVVRVVELVDVDRRELVALDHRRVDPRPAVPQPAVDRQEPRVEVS